MLQARIYYCVMVCYFWRKVNHLGSRKVNLGSNNLINRLSCAKDQILSWKRLDGPRVSAKEDRASSPDRFHLGCKIRQKACGGMRARTRIDEAIRRLRDRSKRARSAHPGRWWWWGGLMPSWPWRGVRRRRGGRVDDEFCYHGDRAARKSRESDRWRARHLQNHFWPDPPPPFFSFFWGHPPSSGSIATEPDYLFSADNLIKLSLLSTH